VKNYLVKNCSKEKESGGELSERSVQRKDHPAENCPVKNVSNKNEAKKLSDVK
jgi:hypothetical protein